MPPIPPALIAALIEQVLVPEISAIIRAHRNATGGTMPTDAQIIAALGTDANTGISIGEAWLAAHPVLPAVVK